LSITGAGIYASPTKHLGQQSARLGKCRFGRSQLGQENTEIKRVVWHSSQNKTILFMIQFLAGLVPPPESKTVSHQALVFVALANLAFVESQREDKGLVFCPGLTNGGSEIDRIDVSMIETRPDQTPEQLQREKDAFFSEVSLTIRPSNWTLINLLQRGGLILEASTLAAQIANLTI
jgi:hypothetical protein